jgi:hypothetical protein
MAGEQVFCDNVTPFLAALSMDVRSRNICLLTVWALGEMDMNDEDKKLASNTLVQLAEQELTPSSKKRKLRYLQYFAGILSPSIISLGFSFTELQAPWQPPSQHLSNSALMLYAKHQMAIENAYFLHVALIQGAVALLTPFLILLSLTTSGIQFCQQLLRETGISLFALDQPESTSLRVLWSLKGGVKSSNVLDGLLKLGRLHKSRSELIISMMNAVSSENRGQLGFRAMERMSSLLLKLDYVNYEVSDTPVALSLLGALYRAGDSRAIPAVKTVLKRTNNPSMRLAAQQTLEALEEQRVGSENLLHVTDEHGTDTLLRVGAVDTTTHVDLLRPSISTTEDVVHSTPTVIPTASRDEEKIELSNRAG